MSDRTPTTLNKRLNYSNSITIKKASDGDGDCVQLAQYGTSINDEEDALSNHDNGQSPSPSSGRLDDECEINLDNNDDLNYDVDEVIPPQSAYACEPCSSPKHTEDFDDQLAQISDSEDSHEESQQYSDEKLEKLSELREDISIEAEDESDIEREEEAGELHEENDERNKELIDGEDLEDGEIVDSDDGIPEIKCDLSPSEYGSPQLDVGIVNPIKLSIAEPNYKQDRELCRFYFKGNCKNGDICRFRHAKDTIVNLKMANYSRIAIPPPIGPPVPLLSTQFPPPLTQSLISTTSLLNTTSAAWEQGLKKARDIVRRQKGDSTEIDIGAIKEEIQQKESLNTLTTNSSNASRLPCSFNNDLQRFTRYSAASRNRHTNTSRLVVEAVSLIPASSYGYDPKNIINKSKKPSIPSLIESIIEHPVQKPPPSTHNDKWRASREDKLSQRSTLTTDIYYDPWARHTKDKNEGTIADQQKNRKRRWNSSSSSSKDRNERNSEYSYRRKKNQNLHHQNETRSDSHRDKQKVTDDRTRDSRKSFEEESKQSKYIEKRKFSSKLDHSEETVEPRKIVRSRKNNSDASSITSDPSDLDRNDKSPTDQTLVEKSIKRRTPSMAKKSMNSHSNQIHKSHTDYNISEEASNKGPRTPPIEGRSNSRSTSVSYSSDEKDRCKYDAKHKISSERNQLATSIIHPSDEDDDAPAAYRLSRQLDEKDRLKRRSSSSSSISSSLSSSTSSSANSKNDQEMNIRNRKGIKKRSSAQTFKATTAKICSSVIETKISDQSSSSISRISSTELGHVEESNSLINSDESSNNSEVQNNTKQLAASNEQCNSTEFRKVENAEKNVDSDNGKGPALPRNKRRRQELLEQLESVEKEIARKRQLKESKKDH